VLENKYCLTIKNISSEDATAAKIPNSSLPTETNRIKTNNESDIKPHHILLWK